MQGDADVVVGTLDTLKPGRLVLAPDEPFRPLRKTEEPGGVAPAHEIRLARELQSLLGKLTDGLQHPEARFAVPNSQQKVLVNEPRDRREHIEPEPLTYCLDGVERSFTRESANSTEHTALWFLQEIVTPGNCVDEGPLSLRCVAWATRREAQVVRQPRQNSIQAERTGPGRRQLNREGKPIQPAADLCNGRRVLFIDRESRVGSACPLHEEGGGRGSGECVPIRSRGSVWQGERGETVSMLPTDVQRLSTGGEDCDVRGGRHQIGHVGSGGYDVFQIVQEQQKVSVCQGSPEALQLRAVGMLDYAQRLGDRIQDEPRIANRGQIYEHHAIVKLRGHGAGQFDCEPRLADPRRTRDGDKPHVAAHDDRQTLFQVLRATNQRMRARR
jgi:hypothetical protein